MTTKPEDLDPPACPWCGAMAGTCSDFPNCPGGHEPGKPFEVVFAPGCFDGFEGTPEQLAELIAEIHQKFANGVPDGLERLSPEESESLHAQIEKTKDRQ